MAQAEVRTASWGHWGIAFCEYDSPRAYAPSKIHGTLYFPVGARGPIDARPGDRERYRAIIRNWVDGGALPEGLSA